VVLRESKIEIKSSGSEVVIDGTAGEVALKGTAKVSVSAPEVSVRASAQLTLESGSGIVTIRGTVVNIN
jgi:hypothetical protein